MSLSQRRLWKTLSGIPASRAAATSSRPASALGANGLSAIVGTPAASACRTSSRRVCGGVVMVTASTPASRRSAEESYARTSGKSSASSARRSGERVTTPASSTPRAAAMNGAWK